MTLNHQKYYTDNNNYAEFLDTQETAVFDKYVSAFIKNTKKDDTILDVGCGTGIAIQLIKDRAPRRVHGIEIGNASVDVCLKKQLNCKLYDGTTIPFEDNYFNAVGSFNVLEHTDDPINFLNEQYRVLKTNGVLIIVCPNFLSITNSYHPHTSGMIRKMQNFGLFIKKTFQKNAHFPKMSVIKNDIFKPDDDAVNATNPLDISHWAQTKKLTPIYWSSQQQEPIGIQKTLDQSLGRYFLGACFFVFKNYHKFA